MLRARQFHVWPNEDWDSQSTGDRRPTASSHCPGQPLVVHATGLRSKVHPALNSFCLLLFPSPVLTPECSGDFEGLCPSPLRIPSRSFGIHSWDLLQTDSHSIERCKHTEPAGRLPDIPVSTIFYKLYVPKFARPQSSIYV